ncbi:DUF6678 family protein [Bradyrhizobium sp. PUT101]|uniref:DUF6678 family protein n=1 Tax=Bradyrhizobium sp. PUT101 TaxID=3447427 RepID=UPI003F824750
MIKRSEYFSVANDTKWRELREAVLDLAPRYRPRTILKRIRLAGEETTAAFRVYGYLRNGEVAGYVEQA